MQLAPDGRLVAPAGEGFHLCACGCPAFHILVPARAGAERMPSFPAVPIVRASCVRCGRETTRRPS